MIVLDEQLKGRRRLDTQIGRWYHGPVIFVTELRPNTVIKDEAIPVLLRQANLPTFITINETDFWRKFPADERFCLICFALSDAKADEIPQRLRQLLQMPEFASKANRMGKVIRVTNHQITFYTTGSRQLITIQGE